MWDAAKITLLGIGRDKTWTQASDFRLRVLSTILNLLSAYLAWVWASQGTKAIYLFNPPVGCLALLQSEADQCTPIPDSHFAQTHVGWISENSRPLLEKNSSCWCVSHQGHLCAWRTAYYVEKTNQGINWNGIEAWIKLGSLLPETLLTCSLFTWWLRSKSNECRLLYYLYQEAVTWDPCSCCWTFNLFSLHPGRPEFTDESKLTFSDPAGEGGDINIQHPNSLSPHHGLANHTYPHRLSAHLMLQRSFQRWEVQRLSLWQSWNV